MHQNHLLTFSSKRNEKVIFDEVLDKDRAHVPLTHALLRTGASRHTRPSTPPTEAFPRALKGKQKLKAA